ncbi:XPG protein [Cooperia oncophora]
MGINNLLPFVKNACRQGNVAEFAGCSVAVDVSCLLHRGLFGCVESIVQGKKTNFYVYYVEKHIKALLNLGCHVVMVFDGRPIPARKVLIRSLVQGAVEQDTNDGRRQRRADNVKAGELLLAEGKVNEAMNKFKQATSITSDVVESAIQHFRGHTNVDVIVSPYESDAQLAFLVNEHFADVVITEDSDLIAFACEKSGLPGIGLNKALSFFSKTSRTDLRKLLPRIPHYLNMSKLSVSKEFIEDFIRAENTFLYQAWFTLMHVVFDPRQRCQRPLTPYPYSKNADKRNEDDADFVNSNTDACSDENFSYAGEVLSSNLAVRLALGNQVLCHVCFKRLVPPSTLSTE